MNSGDIPRILNLLAPEIVLCGLTFGVLLMDIISFRNDSVEKRQGMLGTGVILGLGLVLVIYLLQAIEWRNIFILGHGAFVGSRLNTLFKVAVIFLAIITVMIGARTPYSSHVGEYYSLLLFSVLGMVFLISSEDLLMIFVALELISLSLYALTAFQKGARRSVEAGLKYFIFGGFSSAFLLFGLSYIYGATGHTGLREIAATLGAGTTGVSARMLDVGVLFTLVGLGFKVAAAPFHLWAPDAYEGAPTPVAAMIATGSKVASFVALTKILLIGLPAVAGTALSWPSEWRPGWAGIVAVVAVLSMAIGNIAAITQTNVKRLLAYSSVAHAGYILVAIVAVNAAGIPAASAAPAIYFYILIYALTNIGAFGVVNAVGQKAGGDDFEHFTGMARRSPLLALLMLIFMLSLAGIPPLAGFFGKFYLFASAVQADPSNLGLLWLVIFAIAMSAVSLYYYLKITKQMYVLPAKDPRRVLPGLDIEFALGLVGALVVILGVFPSEAVGKFVHLNENPDPIWQPPVAAAPAVPAAAPAPATTPVPVVTPAPAEAAPAPAAAAKEEAPHP